MIIKCLRRKEPSFAQLYDYMSEKSSHMALLWNLPSITNPEDRSAVVAKFSANAKHLHTIYNANFLFHEIVSLKDTQAVPPRSSH